MASVNINTAMCCYCTCITEKKTADTVCDLMPHHKMGFRVALCFGCAAKSSEWKLDDELGEWLTRSGKTASFEKLISANKCVCCCEEGKDTDATTEYEGVPMCRAHAEFISLQFTYLTPYELGSWPNYIAWLQTRTREKKMTWSNVRFV
jgi:hypothetical protein